MSEEATTESTLDKASFSALVGADIVDLIFEKAPTKVATRIGSALRHYNKAIHLNNVDDEMGVIRLIAAEEELVVAIFEWLKLNANEMPEHGDFIGKYKNHQVKLAFSPVLAQLGFVLADMLHHGLTVEGLEDALHWNVKAVRSDDKVVLRLFDQGGNKIIDLNPLAVSISLPGLSDSDVVETLYTSFSQTLSDQSEMTVRQYISVRAEYRNKMHYAEDGNTYSMAENPDFLIRNVFSRTIRNLLWCLAILLSNSPENRNWGLVSQFISLYRKVLIQSKVLKSSEVV